MAKTMMTGPRLAPQSTLDSAQYAAKQIRNGIVSGSIKPGERLVEMDLARELNVSRHPIREAIRLLAREGFVELRLNRGAVVSHVDAHSILEVYEIRAALGSLALRHLLSAGLGPSPKQLKLLEKLARQTVSLAAKGAAADMSRHDLEFQAAVVDASGLTRAAIYFRELGAHIERFINVLRIDYPDKEETARREVLGLFEAIKNRDHNRADNIWHDKFKVAAQRLVALVPGADHEALSPKWQLTVRSGP